MTETLALFGGPKTATEAFPPWPRLSERAVAEASEALRSGKLASYAGNRVASFERAWAAWCGATEAVAVSSGTAALHATLVALGIGAGHEVIVPSHTFAATALAVLHAGATPVFCDVAEDQTLDARGIEALATERTRALIAVHLYGIVCDLGRIQEAASAFGLAVVEDCAQAIGAEWRDRRVGAVGDVGCFSFSQTKHLTTAGEGGMVATGRAEVAAAVRSLRDYGRRPPAQEPSRESGEGGMRAELPALEGAPLVHERPGWNYRMTEVQAAVGESELERFDDWNLARRRGFARIYDHAFGQLPGVLHLPHSTEERRAALWYYPLQLDLGRLTCDAVRVREALVAEGVPVGPVPWAENYQEPALAGRFRGGPCSVAERLRARTVALCLHPTWERSHIELVIAAVRKVLKAFKR